MTAFTVIQNYPTIDAPLLCLYLNAADMIDPGFRGHQLAIWLNERHRDAWTDTCKAVDELIEAGSISFSDDGELVAIGYKHSKKDWWAEISNAITQITRS